MTHDDELHDHDRGLSHDLPTLSRRRTLTLFGGAGLAAALAGCGIGSTDESETADSPGPSSTSGAGSTDAESETVTSSTGTEIPEETAGPYRATVPTASTFLPRPASSAATSPRASDRRPRSRSGCH